MSGKAENQLPEFKQSLKVRVNLIMFRVCGRHQCENQRGKLCCCGQRCGKPPWPRKIIIKAMTAVCFYGRNLKRFETCFVCLKRKMCFISSMDLEQLQMLTVLQLESKQLRWLLVIVGQFCFKMSTLLMRWHILIVNEFQRESSMLKVQVLSDTLKLLMILPNTRQQNFSTRLEKERQLQCVFPKSLANEVLLTL